MAVLATLAAILVPSGLRAAAIGRRTQCAANLHGIGQAYPMYLSDHYAERDVLSDDSWATALLPYFNERVTQYLCPEDREPDWTWPMVGMRLGKGMLSS